MADEEQIAILKQGVDVWKAWRMEFGVVRPDLRDAKLSAANLSGADLSAANLRNADLRNADLRNADLRNANLSGADLRDAKLRGADLSYAHLIGADLRAANLISASLSHADLRDAKLTGAHLREATLNGAYLREAHLIDANLSYAHLIGAHLIGANLRDAKLSAANLRDAHFIGANLSHADLRDAKLDGADFDASSLGKTTFGSVALDSVERLANCRHRSPSTVGLDTLELSKGKIPAGFLKGCGFSDWQIAEAKLHDPNLRPDEVEEIIYEVFSLRTSGPIQVSSVFFSYSRDDSPFVDLVQERLDKDGIRSWRDVHDMAAGPIEEQLSTAIEMQRTVLLVLSENSLGSTWVEWEVKRADEMRRKLEKEKGERVHVLCPIALDDSWKSSGWPGWLRDQLEKYNILDLSEWKNKGSFEEKYLLLRKGIVKYYGE